MSVFGSPDDMKTLILSIFVLLIAFAGAAPGGYGHGGVILTGPSGVVTNNGPVGPTGIGGFGFGGYGGFPGIGYRGFGGYAGAGGHGIVISGPPTVPATIIGPSGKIVADGLYGVPAHGHGW